MGDSKEFMPSSDKRSSSMPYRLSVNLQQLLRRSKPDDADLLSEIQSTDTACLLLVAKFRAPAKRLAAAIVCWLKVSLRSNVTTTS